MGRNRRLKLKLSPFFPGVHRPLVLRPSAAGLTTDSVTSASLTSRVSVRVGGERKKEEKGKTKEKRGKMSRIFEKKKQKKNKSTNWPLAIFKT